MQVLFLLSLLYWYFFEKYSKILKLKSDMISTYWLELDNLLPIIILKNSMKILKNLIENNIVDINFKEGLGGDSLLINAVRYNKKEIMKYLLSKNINVNLRNKAGFSALMIACSFCDIEMIELLLSYKANPDFMSNRGHTALTLLPRESEAMKKIVNKIDKLLRQAGAE
jgi:ankyrin repeat protein